jgi:hypothetical protein
MKMEVDQIRLPEQGKLVIERDRHWVVGSATSGSLPIDETSGSDPGIRHLVSLVSVEDDGSTEDSSVIWEIESRAQNIEAATLPEPRIDHSSRLSAFLDAGRRSRFGLSKGPSVPLPLGNSRWISRYLVTTNFPNCRKLFPKVGHCCKLIISHRESKYSDFERRVGW